MPKRRANGEGNIRKRKDGRWEGRYTAGYDANGKTITKNVLGRTQAEVKDKLRAAIEDSKKTRSSESRELYTRTVAETVVFRLRRAAGAIFNQGILSQCYRPSYHSEARKCEAGKADNAANPTVLQRAAQERSRAEEKPAGAERAQPEPTHGAVRSCSTQQSVRTRGGRKADSGESGKEMQNSEKYSQGNEHPARSIDRSVPERSEGAWDSRTDVSGADNGPAPGRTVSLTVGGFGRSEPHVVHQ